MFSGQQGSQSDWQTDYSEQLNGVNLEAENVANIQKCTQTLLYGARLLPYADVVNTKKRLATHDRRMTRRWNMNSSNSSTMMQGPMWLNDLCQVLCQSNHPAAKVEESTWSKSRCWQSKSNSKWSFHCLAEYVIKENLIGWLGTICEHSGWFITQVRKPVFNTKSKSRSNENAE